MNSIVHRPWGYYVVLDNGPGYQIKKIVVNPGGQLSLQSHLHRSEQWMVIYGTATVTRDNEILKLQKNNTVFIPVNAKHRLENFTDNEMAIIELQLGDYLGEDDIIRYNDVYGRS